MSDTHYGKLLMIAGMGILTVGQANAATIVGWNTGNVEVAPATVLPDDEGITGTSVVYDRAIPDAAAVSNGAIAFTPPEAVSPGIKVQAETYTQGGPAGITLDGCLMTSNPGATCTSEFQSGKRIKQEITGLGAVDLVFDIDPTGADSTYQVFHRLINKTTQTLAGFAIELGFGVGNDFVQAVAADGISFNSGFRAQPTGSGAASTQFPFGLFGDAATNPNFELDGFFAAERTGFDVSLGDVSLSSTGLFGPYDTFFDGWLSKEDVPDGALWEFEVGKDPLVMAWQRDDGIWELRRDFVGGLGIENVVSLTGTDIKEFASFEALQAHLGLGDALLQDAIEDLANLNVNFAVALGDVGDRGSFTLRTTVLPQQVAAVPLPAGAPLLLAGLGMLVALRRRRQLVA